MTLIGAIKIPRGIKGVQELREICVKTQIGAY
ncbi:hypothetical protein SAMN06272722_111118 [Paenibacillus sp. RU5A]|nr:hypothetical protein SAMN06272722_111118 [Paenibacillus sp. RU5A]SOC74813.1 hypothetical protein SAMN05880581_111118 [Paenibacillus sp. RU26A]SOC76931.1 hypothetical protein SAMN05880586_111118 [Paenibacillus sp. RU5M]